MLFQQNIFLCVVVQKQASMWQYRWKSVTVKLMNQSRGNPWVISYLVLSCLLYDSSAGGLSRGGFESFFEHFTKFNIKKTDFLQNSVWEKRTLHKIQYEKNGLFAKFNIRKTDSAQNWRVFMFYVFRRALRPALWSSCTLPFFRNQK